jgi:glycosyltransferase involved in cell wall biosynthesis
LNDDEVANVTIVIPVHDDDVESDWCKQAVDSFPRGTPFVLAVNTGNVAESVNDAVAYADTKWVMVFSHDNVAHPFMLENMLSMGFAADVVYQGIRGVGENLDEHWHVPVPPFCPNRLLDEAYVPAASLVLRESFLQVGGYREEAAPLEAWDMQIRGLRAGWRFKPCQVTAYDKRLREGSRVTGMTQQMRDEIVGETPEMLATFYYQATHACAYLRCNLPAKYLPGVAHPDLYGYLDEDEMVFPYHQGKAAVMQFAGDKGWALMQEHLQVQGVRTLVEVDDNYLYDPGKKLRGKSNWQRKLGDGIHTYEGHRKIVKRADGVIVTTPRLADSYAKFNDNVFVIPNPVDPYDWQHVSRRDDGIFRVAWFASTSHMPDAHLIQEGMKWASAQPDVQVLVLGINPHWKFPYTQLPWVNDLDMYRLLMGMVDVGVCPIKPDPFSVYRSDVKASEYNMGGAAVVCSDVAPYRDRVHESDCLKARDTSEFTAQIKRLVNDREETKALAAAGKEWTLRNRHIEVLVPLWKEALQVESRVFA